MCAPSEGSSRATSVSLIQVVASFFLFLILGRYASPEDPTLGQAAIVFLLMGCWALTTAFQLERMDRLVASSRPESSAD